MFEPATIKVDDSRHHYIVVRQTSGAITIGTPQGQILLLTNPDQAEALGKALFHAASEARK